MPSLGDKSFSNIIEGKIAGIVNGVLSVGDAILVDVVGAKGGVYSVGDSVIVKNKEGCGIGVKSGSTESWHIYSYDGTGHIMNFTSCPNAPNEAWFVRRASDLYGTDDVEIYRTTTGGYLWECVATIEDGGQGGYPNCFPYSHNIQFLRKTATATELLLCANYADTYNQCKIFKSYDGGVTWVQKSTGTIVNMRRFVKDYDGELMALGFASQPTFYTSDDFGETWVTNTTEGGGPGGSDQRRIADDRWVCVNMQYAPAMGNSCPGWLRGKAFSLDDCSSWQKGEWTGLNFSWGGYVHNLGKNGVYFVIEGPNDFDTPLPGYVRRFENGTTTTYTNVLSGIDWANHTNFDNDPSGNVYLCYDNILRKSTDDGVNWSNYASFSTAFRILHSAGNNHFYFAVGDNVYSFASR